MAVDRTVLDEATAWAVRTGDPAFADWQAFTLWLEADPAHAAAYDTVMAAVDDIAESDLPAASEQVPLADNVVSLRATRRRWIGGALAACLAGAVAVGVWQLRDRPATYETAPGQVRELALADGSRVALAGGTRIAVSGGGRDVELVEGQALFTVRHDERHPFAVTVGEDTLLDVGTVFDVRKDGPSLAVAVSEGAVVFNPEGEALRIDPGQRLLSRDGRVTIGESPAALVGEWREGRLTFRDASLADVAADLSRATGIGFRVAEGAGGARVSGSVMVDPIRRDPASLGPLLGVSVVPVAKGWSIRP